MEEQMISVERLKAGDEMAFRHLFDAYYQALCLFAVDYLGDDAEAAMLCRMFYKVLGTPDGV
ncbi:MAG: RNA polymerase sigma factor [Odoribacter splanchnicus]